MGLPLPRLLPAIQRECVGFSIVGGEDAGFFNISSSGELVFVASRILKTQGCQSR